MPAVFVPAIPVHDPNGQPLLEARGAVGTIYAEGTTTPLTLTQDKEGVIVIPQPITITPGGYIPAHWNQEGVRGTFVPLSGTWSTPVWSPQGLEESAAVSAAAAEQARDAVAAYIAAAPITADELAAKADKATVNDLQTSVTDLTGRVVILEGGTLGPAPTASFTHTVTNLAASFDGSTSTAPEGRTITSYFWAFGDGNTATTTVPTVSHNYDTAGTYEVAMRVTDSEGATGTATKAVTILAAANQGPTASFTHTANGATVAFDGTGSSDPDGSIVSYAWVLGDGNTVTGPQPIHTYATSGTYTVGLTVTDDAGATHSTTRSVSVAAPAATTYVWIESPTPTATQTAFADAMIARGATLTRRPDTISQTDLAALADQPGTVLVVTDGTTTTSLAGGVQPYVAGATRPAVIYKTELADAVGYTPAKSLQSSASVYISAANVGRITSAGVGSGFHNVTATAQNIYSWMVADLPAGHDTHIHRDSALSRSAQFELDAGELGKTGSALTGWRAIGSWIRDASSGWTAAAFDFMWGLLQRAAEVAGSAPAPGGVTAPTLAPVEQIETTSTGGRVRLTGTLDAADDLLLFSADTYSTNGGLPFATILTDGTTTRVYETPAGTSVPAGSKDYWLRARRPSDQVLSPESNHRAFTVTSSAPPPEPTVSAVLLPFGNTASYRYEVNAGYSGTPPVQPPVWRLGVVTAPTLEAADSSATVNLRTITNVWVNQGQYGHELRYAANDTPVVTVQDRGDPGRQVTGHVPADMEAAVGSDAHAHVLQPDGVTILEMIGFQRIDAQTVSASRVHKVRVDRAGIGPAAGVRANGGSALAGLIRAWEVDPTHPNYTGRIDHPLSLALRGEQLKHMRDTRFDPWGYHSAGVTDQTGQPGWPTGIRRAGPTDQPNEEGFMRRVTRFIASEEDWNGASSTVYTGQVPMGTYVVLPGSVTPESIGTLNAEELMMFRALQDYGAIITDLTHAVGPTYYIERSAPSAFRNAIKGSSINFPNITKMHKQLRVVAVNNHDNPNGGPLTAARRGRPVPGFTS